MRFFTARTSKIILICGFLLGALAATQLPNIKFDYRYEPFFPDEDKALAVHKKFTEQFGSDNDFLLIGIENSPTIFQHDFLIKVDSLSQHIEALNEVVRTTSITSLKYPVSGPFNMSLVNYVHLKKPNLLSKDSIRIMNNPDLVGSLVTQNGRALTLLIAHNFQPNRKASDSLVTAIEDLVSAQNFEDYHFVGKIKGQQTFLKTLEVEMGIISGVVILMIMLLLAFFFRSWSSTLIPIIVVLIGTLIMLASLVLSGEKFNFITNLLPLILIITGVSQAIHFLEKFSHELEDQDRLTALKTTIREAGMANLLTTLTTAAGFAALLTSLIGPIRNFGTITAAGVIVVFLLMMLMLPAALVFITPKKSQMSRSLKWSGILKTVFAQIAAKPKFHLALTALLLGLSLIGAYQVQVNNFFTNDWVVSEEQLEDYRFFDEEFSGFRPLEILLESNDKELLAFDQLTMIAEVDSAIRNIYTTEFIQSPVAFLRTANQAIKGGKVSKYQLPQKERDLKLIKSKFRKQIKADLGFVMTDDQKTIRYSVKVQDFGAQELFRRNARLHEWFVNNQAHFDGELKITGVPLLLNINNRYVVSSMLSGLGIALIVVALVMGILFKSVRIVIIALVVNLLPLVAILGYMGFAGIYLKISTSIIFTMAFGIAVDDTIHFLSKLRIELWKEKPLVEALRKTFISTGKAIIVTTIILSAGFGMFMFSSVDSTFNIGLLLALTLLFAVIFDLITLTALLLLFGHSLDPKRSIRKRLGIKKK